MAKRHWAIEKFRQISWNGKQFWHRNDQI
jgi:hypothetical protein